MKFNTFSIIIFLILGTVVFSSCGKENFDVTSEEEENINTEVVTCDLGATIAEQPPGSGMLYTAVSGGTAPFAYLWSTGETTANIAVNSPGTYSVEITDADGCTVEVSTTQTVDPCLSLSTVITDSGSGELSTSVNGGITPYAYSWSTGETTADITVTTEGTYSVIVEDANGCVVAQSITVSDINDPCSSFSIDITELGCGELSTSVNDGIAPYAYSWSTADGFPIINITTSGTYSVTVTDAIGCTANSSIVIANDPLSASISDFGSGALSVVPDGGAVPYTYQWSTGETTADITVTTDGTYIVLVTDADGCTVEVSITVSINNLCAGFNVTIAEQPPGSGSLFTAVTGGTAPYIYEWSTGESTSNITVNTFGTYSVTITDVNGCVVETEIEI